ncbi:bifunctional riboflavin kinase/FAD synthetase [Flavobacterium amnicola]|uniref:Riboflavin biosynthesis protein n=1 Tax=Flavobacterium amnicola TaxID=2506422 RepID=A0A4Q1K541_9FLAO|nr:bifunctional riboflavin kinase/FAD synthetase [Flavobacterium amnicola]RXR20702.1 bifunctional riboflavin kinase/FAD synthetase [Flavobacterium amnicola]
MNIFHSLSEYNSNQKTVLTIGTFDGVHLGHQKILQRILNNTKDNNTQSIVLTFAQHPRTVLQSEYDIKLLNTTEEKIHQLEKTGIDNLMILEFNAELSNLSGEEFVKNILVDKLNIQKVIIGYDHKFGKNRASDIHDLINFGKKYHFDVEQISAEELNEITISSTKIRNAILDGNIELANQYLGYTFSFSGIVVKGNQIGRTINFPTANIALEDTQKILPKNGVYIVEGSWNGNAHIGMMNIGIKPTLNENKKTIEVHFLDLNEDLYDKEITIAVHQFVRAEQKFNSIEELKNQLSKDKEATLSYFKKGDN